VVGSVEGVKFPSTTGKIWVPFCGRAKRAFGRKGRAAPIAIGKAPGEGNHDNGVATAGNHLKYPKKPKRSGRERILDNQQTKHGLDQTYVKRHKKKK